MTDRATRLAAFERLLAATPDLPRKGKANPYSSMNGNMVAFIGKDDTLALRLPKARRAQFLEQHPDSVVVSYNTVMKDYGYKIGNIDVTLILERPKVASLKPAMKENIVKLLNTTPGRVNIKARTHERVDSVGELRSLSCHVVLTLERTS